MKDFLILTERWVKGPITPHGCNAVEFINLSSTNIVYIDGRPIPAYVAGMQQYPSICYYGLQGEAMTGQFAVSGTTPELLIVRKFYDKKR